MSHSVSVPMRRRGARQADGGRALFDAFAGTVGLLRWLMIGLIAIYSCSGITRIGPNEDAVVFRFGVLQQDVHAPGLLFALPEPFDRVVRVPTRTQHEVFLHAWSPDEESAAVMAGAPTAVANSTPAGAAAATGNARIVQNPALLAVLPGTPTAPSARPKGFHPVFDGYTLTADANIIQARFTARYRIVDPRAWVSAAAPNQSERLVETAVYAAATRTLAGMPIDAALGQGLESLRDQVRQVAQARVEALHLGIDLLAFEVHLISPPLPTVGAFSEVTSAQVESRTTLEQARTHRAQTVPKAAAEAYRMRRQADAGARQLTTKAAGEASAFVALLAEHRRAPGLVETRLRAEALEEILPRVKSKTVLPTDDATVTLLLPDHR